MERRCHLQFTTVPDLWGARMRKPQPACRLLRTALLLACAGSLSIIADETGFTMLRTDFSQGVDGWENRVLANTSVGLAFVRVATALRHECRRRSNDAWDKTLLCEVQGDDAGGLEFSRANIEQQRETSTRAAISIKTADATAVPVEKETWFFVSPPAWSRDISQAYDGFLLLRIVHRVIPARARVPGPDVMLTARCGYHVWHKLSIDEGLAGRMHKLRLNEGGGWIDSRTNKPPSRQSLLGVFANLLDLKIRGGYFYGYEVTSLVTAEVVKGENAPFPCCDSEGGVSSCSTRPSPSLTDSQTRFPCEGERHESVRVRQVLPRFARRTGGATITVIGENFGVAGTHPIVRIAGRACMNTSIWEPPSHCRNNISDPHLGETGVDRGGECYPELCFNGIKNSETLEELVDCGGRCAPCEGGRGNLKPFGAPSQVSMLRCISPAFSSDELPAVPYHLDGHGESMDVPVVVDAMGRRSRMADRNDGAVQTSCISPESRGFQFGALDPVWRAHLVSNASSLQLLDIVFALESGKEQQGGAGSYEVGRFTGQLELESLSPSKRDRWRSSEAATGRGFVVKRDATGQVSWACVVSAMGDGGIANVSLESVAAAIPAADIVPPPPPPPGMCPTVAMLVSVVTWMQLWMWLEREERTCWPARGRVPMMVVLSLVA